MPSAIEIRDIDPDDLDAALRVRFLSFGALSVSADDWRTMARRFIDDRHAVGAYVDGRLAGTARINDFRQWWHGRDVRMGGIAGVVVGPEHRGQGVGRALMTGVIERLRELGYPTSALYPATVPVYRALGWELSGRQYRMSVPAETVRTLARQLDSPVAVRPAVPGDGQAIVDLLDRCWRDQRDDGPISYPARDWEEDLGGAEDAAIYLADDGLVEYDWNRDGGLHVGHLSALSEQTTRTLWALVGSGSSIAKTIVADLAPDDPLPLLIPDLGVTPVRETWWMLRLLDPAASFAGRGYPDGASVEASFRLTDAQLPHLDGGWVLSVADGAGTFERGSAGARPYEVGPRGLAALYAGTRLSVLRRSGVIGGGTAATDAALDATFAGTPYMNDYF